MAGETVTNFWLDEINLSWNLRDHTRQDWRDTPSVCVSGSNVELVKIDNSISNGMQDGHIVYRVERNLYHRFANAVAFYTFTAGRLKNRNGIQDVINNCWYKCRKLPKEEIESFIRAFYLGQNLLFNDKNMGNTVIAPSASTYTDPLSSELSKQLDWLQLNLKQLEKTYLQIIMQTKLFADDQDASSELFRIKCEVSDLIEICQQEYSVLQQDMSRHLNSIARSRDSVTDFVIEIWAFARLIYYYYWAF